MSIEVKDKDGNVIAYTHEGREPFKSKVDLHTPPHFRYPSTMNDLITFAKNTFNKCIGIAIERNKRYAGAYDPFKNFRMGGAYGIAIRLGDKVSRLETLLHPSNTVGEDHESIEDTCLDIINYAMLLRALRSNERGTSE